MSIQLTLAHLNLPPEGEYVYDTILEMGPHEMSYVTTERVRSDVEVVEVSSEAVGTKVQVVDTIKLNRRTLALQQRLAQQANAVISVQYGLNSFTTSRQLDLEQASTLQQEGNLIIDGPAEGYLLACAALEVGVLYQTDRFDAQTGRLATYHIRALAPTLLEQHPLQPTVRPIEIRTAVPSAEYVCYYADLAHPGRILHVDSVSPVGGATMRSTLRLK